MPKKKQVKNMALNEANQTPQLSIPLTSLLELVAGGKLEVSYVDKDGYIHFNDNGTQIMYDEMPNLRIPYNLVSRI